MENIKPDDKISESSINKVDPSAIMANTANKVISEKFKPFMDIANSVMSFDIDKLIDQSNAAFKTFFTDLKNANMDWIQENFKKINKDVVEEIFKKNKIKLSELKKLTNLSPEQKAEIDNLSNLTIEDLNNKANVNLTEFLKFIESLSTQFKSISDIEKLFSENNPIIQEIKNKINENLKGLDESKIKSIVESKLSSAVDDSTEKFLQMFFSSVPTVLLSLIPFTSTPPVAYQQLTRVGSSMAEPLIKEGIGAAITISEETQKALLKGGRKKRKSKSKHFYIKRIKRTLKQFFNY